MAYRQVAHFAFTRRLKHIRPTAYSTEHCNAWPAARTWFRAIWWTDGSDRPTVTFPAARTWFSAIWWTDGSDRPTVTFPAARTWFCAIWWTDGSDRPTVTFPSARTWFCAIWWTDASDSAIWWTGLTDLRLPSQPYVRGSAQYGERVSYARRP